MSRLYVHLFSFLFYHRKEKRNNLNWLLFLNSGFLWEGIVRFWGPNVVRCPFAGCVGEKNCNDISETGGWCLDSITLYTWLVKLSGNRIHDNHLMRRKTILRYLLFVRQTSVDGASWSLSRRNSLEISTSGPLPTKKKNIKEHVSPGMSIRAGHKVGECFWVLLGLVVWWGNKQKLLSI